MVCPLYMGTCWRYYVELLKRRRIGCEGFRPRELATVSRSFALAVLVAAPIVVLVVWATPFKHWDATGSFTSQGWKHV
jgi:hypothetical protein